MYLAPVQCTVLYDLLLGCLAYLVYRNVPVPVATGPEMNEEVVKIATPGEEFVMIGNGGAGWGDFRSVKIVKPLTWSYSMIS